MTLGVYYYILYYYYTYTYYILLYIIHILLLYLILYSSPLLIYSFPFPILLFLIFFSPSLPIIPFLPSPNHSFPLLFSFPIYLPLPFISFKVYVSAFGYPYLYSSSIQSFQYPFPTILTPHVLSEWMVEV